MVQAAVLLVVVAWLAAGRLWRPSPEKEPATAPSRVVLERVGYEDLPGWREDDPAAAWPVLLRSCAAWERRGAVEWGEFCRAAEELTDTDTASVRAFLESTLAVFSVSGAPGDRGLFTGYYEPTVRGSLAPVGGYRHALYRRPPELVEVSLGAFRGDLEGRRIAGTVAAGRLLPFADRSRIDQGALVGRGLELVWLEDPVDAFFLHIQGSGRVELREGGVIRVGYAGQNGHAYFAIGRELVARGALTVEEVSMQSIRAWLASHPDEAAVVMARNPSYVFFRRVESDGPIGSFGVELTAERSLAVDRRYVPLGAPVWLETSLPAGEAAEEALWRRLMLAQDTGGAIRGAVRGDVYWGSGARAEELAGRMRQEGRLWLLLPSALAAETEARTAASE